MKAWYLSKTLWANGVALIAMIVQGITGNEILPMNVQVIILSVINLALRMITKEKVAW